jgi:serine/threonine-protein kinase
VLRARRRTGPSAGREVALKRLLPERRRDAEAREALVSEADLTRMLRHPHIVSFVELGEVDGLPYLALELVEGMDLSKLLAACRKRRFALPRDVCLFVAQRLLEALEHAHQATSPSGRSLGLVHCDVSPGNVLLGLHGEVKLADFGVARARWVHEAPAHRVGKQHYRSPELLAGQVSQAADLWAAAVVLYEMLALEYPFPEGSAEEVAAAIGRGQAIPLRARLADAPPELAQVVDRALSPAPAQRFSTAAQFARALRPLQDERVATPLAVAAVVRGVLAAAPAPR